MKKLLLLCCYLFLISGCDDLRKKINIIAPNDWGVSLNSLSTKAANEFDVIVVGAGIGGLSCAAILATNGFKTLVLEQQHQVGGYCTSFQRDGFTFPAGPHDVSGVDRGMVKTLLTMLNLSKEEIFVLHTRSYRIGDKTIVFTGTKHDVVQKLSEVFPHEQQAIVKFFNEAEQAMIEHNASKQNQNYSCATYRQWASVTYQQKFDAFFHDEQLKTFLCSLLGYVGMSPEKTKAGTALMACLSYFIFGGYFPKQGGSAFANALRHVIEARGGIVQTGSRVDEILIQNRQVVGVRAGSQAFLAPVVVANANAKTTLLELVPQGTLEPAFVDAIANLKMSRSAVIVHMGVDQDLSSHASIVKIVVDGKSEGLVINSNADPSMAPLGKASVSVGLHAAYADVPPVGTPAYEDYKKGCLVRAIAKAEKIIPGISEHIVVSNVVTPRTFEQFTSMPEGAFYAFEQSEGSKRPHFKTPIKGLYLASSSTNPGGGVEAVVASGLICARDIMEKSCEVSSAPLSKESGMQRLYRSRTERKIAGVCGGIATYLDVDPTIVRLLWMLSAFFGGMGVIAYIGAWFIIPQEPWCGHR